jgi:hypothetical protein
LISDDAVCIGDRYQLGNALFEVTQPRVTCYRVGIRMNEPRRAASEPLPRGVLDLFCWEQRAALQSVGS